MNGPLSTNEEVQGIIEQMKELGASEAQIEQYRQQQEPDECLVLEANKNAVEWFFSVDDLFITNGQVLLGLDVKAIQADAQMRGLEIEPKDYEKLREIGRKATHYFNTRKAK